MTADENCKAVERLVMEERRIKARQIVAALGLSSGTVEHSLHDVLGLSTVSARWVPRMLTVRLLVDNAPPHVARVSEAATRECGFEKLPYPQYSPEVAPSDYYLFRPLKKQLRGKRFCSENEVISAMKDGLRSNQNYFFARHT